MADAGIPNIAYELDEKRERATLTIGGERIVVGAVELERLVHYLGMIRSVMAPGVEPDVPATPFLQIDAPRLAVRATQDQQWAGLVLRTSPYGWIGFNLDRTQAADLGRHLTDLATRLRPAS